MSLSARRAWIEIKIWYCGTSIGLVALRKESVDRNPTIIRMGEAMNVALRKESVDRNRSALPSNNRDKVSLSARRAWIEISMKPQPEEGRECRSPQGERG